MDPAESARPTMFETRRDAVASAALGVIRRALVEGVPVTRAGLAGEASVTLGTSRADALLQVDVVAQQLGVSSLR